MPDAGRVVTGSAKGLRLAAPGPGTRPLTDRVKQALFGTIEAELDHDWDGPFLDLFAGSGAGGIEALSRGAPGCVFVERDGKAAGVIGENVRRLGLAERDVRIVRADAVRFLDRHGEEEGGPFAAVLLDPPYGDPAILRALERLGEPQGGWLRGGGVVAAKHFWKDVLPDRFCDLERQRERRFGETLLTFYRALP